MHMSSSPKSENFAVSLVPLVVTSIAYSAKALLFSFKLELRNSVEWVFSISQIHWTSFRLIRILLYYFEKIFQPLRVILKRNQLSHRYFPFLTYL